MSTTRPEWIPPPQRSILQVNLEQISLAHQKPNVLWKAIWENKRVTLDFQLWLRTPRHYSARMSVNRHPTTPWGVVYNIDE